MVLDNYKICIIGLGYVGLPLAVAFAKKYKVIGFDIDKSRINQLKDGNDKTLEVNESSLKSVKSNITFTSNIEDAKDCNIFIITVPLNIILVSFFTILNFYDFALCIKRISYLMPFIFFTTEAIMFF